MATRKRDFVLYGAVLFSITIVLHELGHVVGGIICEAGQIYITIWPGVQLFPWQGHGANVISWASDDLAAVTFLHARQALFVTFQMTNNPFDLVPRVYFIDSNPINPEALSPIVTLLGSGTTYLVSVLCLFILYFKKPSGLGFKVLMCGALLYWDLLLYCVMPTVFGLPHLILVGGDTPEPLISLVQIGIAKPIAITMVLLSGVLQTRVLMSTIKPH